MGHSGRNNCRNWHMVLSGYLWKVGNLSLQLHTFTCRPYLLTAVSCGRPTSVKSTRVIFGYRVGQQSHMLRSLDEPLSHYQKVRALSGRNGWLHTINTLSWRHPIVLTVDSNLRIHSFTYESTVDSEQRINSFSMGNSTHDDWSLQRNF